MRERAAVADVCPNAAAHEQQRNGQSKDSVHHELHAGLTNRVRVNRSIHLKATARQQSAQADAIAGTRRGKPVSRLAWEADFARLRVVSGPR
jgi:hypothetical protein